MCKKKIEFVYCHRDPERSFHWNGKQFPLCARCTGIHVGYITYPIFLFGIIKISLVWTIIMLVPTIIDGLTQAYCNRSSNNYLRFVTGIIAGIGAMSLVSIIGKGIGNLILHLIN